MNHHNTPIYPNAMTPNQIIHRVLTAIASAAATAAIAVAIATATIIFS